MIYGNCKMVTNYTFGTVTTLGISRPSPLGGIELGGHTICRDENGRITDEYEHWHLRVFSEEPAPKSLLRRVIDAIFR